MPPRKKPNIKAKKKPITKPPLLEGRDKDGKFTKGNHIWEQRFKHGRSKKFTPETLWKAAEEYFKMYDANPIMVLDWKGKDAKRVEMPHMRAYTWQSLELYLDMYSLRDYKTNPEYTEFSQVIARIERTMYSQKFEGAASGVLNANIIARDLGLREQTHMTVDDDRKIVGDAFPDVLDSKKE